MISRTLRDIGEPPSGVPITPETRMEALNENCDQISRICSISIKVLAVGGILSLLFNSIKAECCWE